MASVKTTGAQCVVDTTQHSCDICNKTFKTKQQVAQHKKDSPRCSKGGKMPTNKKPNSPAKKTAAQWKKEVQKKEVEVDEDLEEFCLDNDDCRRFRYNPKTGIATVKVRAEDGRIYSANDLPTLIKLLTEKMNQKVIRCKNCTDKPRYTTNIFRHMEEFGCSPKKNETPNKEMKNEKGETIVKCKICLEQGLNVFVPLKDIGKHCYKVHKDRKSPNGQKTHKSSTIKCRRCNKHIAPEALKKHNTTCK